MSFECSITGKTFQGLAYILKSTEGEKIVSPDALFSGDAAPDEKQHEQDQAQEIADLKARLDALESAATAPAGEPQPLMATSSSSGSSSGTTSARKTTAAKKSTSKE